jgi:hypothetical protein
MWWRESFCVLLCFYLLISCKVWDDAHLLVNGVVMFEL